MNTIGESMSIIGDVYTEEDLCVNGRVRGTVKAREVLILGSVQGNIEASSKITVRKQGSLVGNIKTSGIVIDDDAYFKGSIDIVRKPG